MKIKKDSLTCKHNRSTRSTPPCSTATMLRIAAIPGVRPMEAYEKGLPYVLARRESFFIYFRMAHCHQIFQFLSLEVFRRVMARAREA